MMKHREQRLHRQATDLIGEAWAIMDDDEAVQDSRDRAFLLVVRALEAMSEIKAPAPLPSPGREVVCRTDPTIRFVSETEAARRLGCSSRTSITQTIRNGGMVSGLFLRFADTPEELCPPMRTKTKAVRWQGKIYLSITEAALDTLPAGTRLRSYHEKIRRNGKRLSVSELLRYTEQMREMTKVA